MITTIPSVAVQGLDGQRIDVEVDIQNGISKFFIVGLPDAAIQESRERVRSAIKNSGYTFPQTRITVNLAPADAKKSGPSFDLPIAIGLVAISEGLERTYIEDSIFVGELALDGAVRPVASILPTVLYARDHGCARIFVPYDNRIEAALVPDIEVIPVRDLTHVVQMLSGMSEMSMQPQTSPDALKQKEQIFRVDFSDVIGQQFAVRALLIAAAGGHNILMEGPPGSGKTFLSQAFSGILPDMTFAEIVDVSRVYSVAGLLSKDHPLIVSRPFRKVHHTASSASIIGGGRDCRPGEISLAHHGVLFLDELLEFPSTVLETLRQPIEDREITINRVHSTFTYPAGFILVGALNPCPCGYFGDAQKGCTCSSFSIERYRKKLSGPLLDRMDIFLQVPRVDVEDLKTKNTTAPMSSNELRSQVQTARDVQRARFCDTDVLCNAHMTQSDIQRYCQMDVQTQTFLEDAVKRFHLSTRAYFRVLKLARTIADISDSELLLFEHVAEALGYRKVEE